MITAYAVLLTDYDYSIYHNHTQVPHTSCQPIDPFRV